MTLEIAEICPNCHCIQHHKVIFDEEGEDHIKKCKECGYESKYDRN